MRRACWGSSCQVPFQSLAVAQMAAWSGTTTRRLRTGLRGTCSMLTDLNVTSDIRSNLFPLSLSSLSPPPPLQRPFPRARLLFPAVCPLPLRLPLARSLAPRQAPIAAFPIFSPSKVCRNARQTDGHRHRHRQTHARDAQHQLIWPARESVHH